MEHFVRMGLLLSCYGGQLTDHQRATMQARYHEDCTLEEIGRDQGVSRQAVADTLHRAENLLEKLESSLGLAARVLETQDLLAELKTLAPQADQLISRLENIWT